MDDPSFFKIRSSIKPELFRITLKKGSLLAGAGALMLLLGGTLLPLSYLKIWGGPLFFIALGLIALGLIPYRKLTQLQLSPHTLQREGDFLIYARKGKPLLKIPYEKVARMEYVEKEELYGIALWIKQTREKIKILDERFDLEGFLYESKQKFGSDLFFPYFTEESFKLISRLESNHAS